MDPISIALNAARLLWDGATRWHRKPKPRWFEGTSSEYRELLARLEVDDYEIKESTPSGAQQYRDDGWT